MKTTPTSENIVIISAIDRWDKWNFNNIGYNFLVHDSFFKIRKAARKKALTVKIIKGGEATTARVLKELQNHKTQRLILLAHGRSTGTLHDVRGEIIDVASFDRSTAGINLQTVDLVGCYASKGCDVWKRKTGLTDIRTYNPTNPDRVIWWNQTNEALDKKIPLSILTGENTSGDPSVKPEPVTSWFMKILKTIKR